MKTLFSVKWFALIGLALGGCTHVHDIVMPDGRQAFVTNCNNDELSDCYQRASRFCPSYRILKTNESRDWRLQCNGWGGCRGGRSDTEMFFECTPGGAPTAPPSPTDAPPTPPTPPGSGRSDVGLYPEAVTSPWGFRSAATYI